MRRVVGLTSLVILILICSSCRDSNDKVDFDSYNTLFIDDFSNEDDINKKNIVSLNAYYYDTRYFYDVSYTYEDIYNDHVLEVLYIYRYGSLNKFFNIENESECYKYYSSYYGYYKEALEKGIKKEYSSEDITNIITDFYGIAYDKVS